MEKNIVIQIKELPKRTEKLSQEKMEQMFGGIFAGHCEPCSCQVDCNINLYCRGNSNSGFYCVGTNELLSVCN